MLIFQGEQTAKLVTICLMPKSMRINLNIHPGDCVSIKLIIPDADMFFNRELRPKILATGITKFLVTFAVQ
ncbi:MAG: hypothetical protein IPH88_17565 [Bacteroidales bacterium]|nr:hypothetical protein [Bacteroidales bacterium]